MIEEIINIALNIFKQFVKPKLESQNYYNEDWTEETAEKLTGEQIETALEELKPEDEVYCSPVEKKKITSPYGWRKLSGMKKHFHAGVDFQGNQRMAFAVVQSVVVKIKSYDRKYPYRWKYLGKRKFKKINVPKGRAWSPYTIIESVHGDYRFVYTHGVEVVKLGQIVNAGQPVIALGNYGNSRLQHLHFEVHKKVKDKWKHIDPEKFLKEKGLI
jgi:murein DD-endopeptidase MepM/ murein hydrolase activator NlpD